MHEFTHDEIAVIAKHHLECAGVNIINNEYHSAIDKIEDALELMKSITKEKK